MFDDPVAAPAGGVWKDGHDVQAYEEPLTVLELPDLLLILTRKAGGRQDFGRTSLQKVAYLASARLGLGDLGHSAHFYGPYSRTLERVMADLVTEGVVMEHREDLGFVARGGRPAVRYSYTLTEPGALRLAALDRTHRDEVRSIEGFVDELLGVVGGLDQRVLSLAAKTLYLAQREGQSLTYAEVGDLARQLGWSLSPAQVDDVAGKLRRLDLLSAS